jgi:hypothetical protein
VTITGDPSSLRDRLYEPYASQHSGAGSADSTRLIYRRDIRPLLPPPSAGYVAVARVPNAVSPFGGRIRYGDFTHETWFTARSVRQLAAASGFGPVEVIGCSPPVHGVVSAIRATI